LGGANIGTVIVFGSVGSSEAASFFLANLITSAVVGTVTPLYEIAYPALSAMNDGRKRFAWKIIKLALLISAPLSLAFIFYSDDVVHLLGQDYSNASNPLKILLLGVIPGSFILMIGNLLYSYGNYRQVLYLGLATSIPRTILYFLLVPAFGAIGGAAGYTIGTMIALILSFVLAKNIGMRVSWKQVALIVIILLVTAFIFSYFQINYILGIIGTVAISLIAFLKVKILTKSDIEVSINILPKGIAKPLSIVLNRVGTALNKDY
jgi:O-antigen/teichoic acid export membrane protein